MMLNYTHNIIQKIKKTCSQKCLLLLQTALASKTKMLEY